MADININGAIIPNDDAWIYDWFGISYTSPANVMDALNAVPVGEQVDIWINSPGGSLFDGVEIYTKLKAYTQGQVKTHVILAASAASVIACAGYCDISPSGQMMIHNVSAYCGGNKADHTKLADVLQTADEAVANAYALKSGLSRDEILSLMTAETWLNAQRAVELKLADAIMFDTANELGANLAAAVQVDSSGLLPSEVIEKCRANKAIITGQSGANTPQSVTDDLKNVSKPPETAVNDRAKAEAKLKLMGLRGGLLS